MLERYVPKTLSPSDISAILRHCQMKRDQAICPLFLESDVRASELVAQHIGNIDLKT